MLFFLLGSALSHCVIYIFCLVCCSVRISRKTFCLRVAQVCVCEGLYCTLQVRFFGFVVAVAVCSVSSQHTFSFHLYGERSDGLYFLTLKCVLESCALTSILLVSWSLTFLVWLAAHSPHSLALSLLRDTLVVCVRRI